MRVYCCDFQSSKLRKHSEVGLGLTNNAESLFLQVEVESILYIHIA